jgi:stage II sporulation protein D
VRDGRRWRRVDARRFRKALGWSQLYSERFSARTEQGVAIFEGRGFGHGVGMCQWGAKGLAQAGRTYRQILRHYYAGARVRRVY